MDSSSIGQASYKDKYRREIKKPPVIITYYYSAFEERFYLLAGDLVENYFSPRTFCIGSSVIISFTLGVFVRLCKDYIFNTYIYL